MRKGWRLFAEDPSKPGPATPDGAKLRIAASSPDGGTAPARGGAGATQPREKGRSGTRRLFIKKPGRFRVNDTKARKSSSPGCPWQGRAGRFFPPSGNGGRRAPHAAVFMDPGLRRDDEAAKRPSFSFSTLCLRAFVPSLETGYPGARPAGENARPCAGPILQARASCESPSGDVARFLERRRKGTT